MIQSLFLLSATGEVVIERHFRGVTSRSVCQTYWEKASIELNHHGGISTTSTIISNNNSNSNLHDRVPVILEVASPTDDSKTLYLISVLRDGMSYLAVCPNEISPLLVLEFLHRVADIFQDYFGIPADESAIRENFSTVYQLLEEMVDYGWPLTTEPNSLKAMIRPPTVMGKIQQAVTGSSNAVISEVLPTGTISNMPWRKSGVKYSQNEVYVDIVEEVDAIVDHAGRVVWSDVSGSIQVQCHLSGVPDLLLTFKDPDVIDDCSFHPCVRYGRFEADKVLSFVPPDGNFELMKYRVKNTQNIITPPIYCTPQLSFVDGDDNGRISVLIGCRTIGSSLIFSSKSKNILIEDVSITIPFPKDVVRTVNLSANYGKVIYDEAAKVAKWVVGKLDDRKKPQLTGTIQWNSHLGKPEENPTLQLSWKIPLASVSGLSVSGLSMIGEAYRPYKGVRSITKSGHYQIRS